METKSNSEETLWQLFGPTACILGILSGICLMVFMLTRSGWVKSGAEIAFVELLILAAVYSGRHNGAKVLGVQPWIRTVGFLLILTAMLGWVWVVITYPM